MIDIDGKLKLIEEIEKDIENKVDSKKIARKFKILTDAQPKARLRSLEEITKSLKVIKNDYIIYKLTNNKKVYWFRERFRRFEEHFLIDLPKNAFLVFDENGCLKAIGSNDDTDIEEYAKKVEEQKRKVDETVQGLIEKYNEAMEKENKST